MNATLIAILTAFMLFAAMPVVAGDLENGRAAYKAGDYQKAFRLFKPLAEKGEAKAQYYLAGMYGRGVGVPKDGAKKVYWYTQAAKQGHADARAFLGVVYAQGLGVPEDVAKAVYWFTLSAKQGRADSQLNLGGMYTRGEGVPKDDERADAWLSIAAAQGDRHAKQFKEIVAKRMTTAQIAGGQKLSRELWEKYVVPFRKD